jgi:hypothetical protein
MVADQLQVLKRSTEEQRISPCAGTKLATVNGAKRENPSLRDGAPRSRGSYDPL